MADFTTHLKSAAWTEIEVGTVVLGSVLAGKFLKTEEIWSQEYLAHPEWFDGPRLGAPFMIRNAGALKAGAAVLASTYIANPWAKLGLMGIAIYGSMEQLRVMTFDKVNSTYRLDKIGRGDASALDSELKRLAKQYRTRGPEYTGEPEYTTGEDDDMSGRNDTPQADRYTSAVAGNDVPQAERYSSAVAGMDDMDGGPFSFKTSDLSEAF